MLAPIDLLTANGTIVFTIDGAGLGINSALFRVDDDDFIFRLGIFDSKIAVQRNNVLITLTPEPMPGSHERVPVFLMWNYNELTLKCGQKDTKVVTAPTAPSARLLKFAREQNLVPAKVYNSEEEFRAKVHSCLLNIQDKINETGAVTAFWNFEHEGHIIKARQPKREPEIHPIIHCVLSDQMPLAGIELVPEFQTGAGDLDFLFLAYVKDRGDCRFCAEFKPAHSNDIYRGLEVKLPTYMRSAGATYGAYCVLGFKGDWFDHPSAMTLSELEFQLQLKKLKSKDPLHEYIRILTFDLSKPPTACTL